MQLTKERKLEILNSSISELKGLISKENYSYGICFLIAMYITEEEHRELIAENYSNIIISLFPEIIKFNPGNICGWWFKKDFNGALKRLSILKETIKEVENA